MRAIPAVPIDGEQYVGPWMGVPSVLEYDAPTGGYKLVVTTETGVAINISGTVEISGGEITAIGGAQYGEDTPHVSGQTGTFVMGIRQDGLSSPVSADGDYSAFLFDYLGRLKTYLDPSQSIQISGTFGPALQLDSDTESNAGYLSTMVGAQILGHSGGVNLRRASMAVDADGADRGTRFSLITAADLRGFDPIAGDWNRVRVEANQHSLYVSLGSGTFPGQGVTFGMNGIIPQNINAGAVASLPFEFVVPNLLWERVNSYDDDDTVLNVRGQRKLVFGHGYNPVADDWDRLIGPKETGLNVSIVSGSFPGQDGATLLDDAVANPYAGLIGSLGLAYDAVGDNWERIRIDSSRNLFVTLVSGSFPVGETLTVDTELPAAVALTSDDVANPTAPAVGAFLLGYDEIADAWDRLRVFNIGTDDNITAALVTPSLVVGSLNMGYDSTAAEWNRMRSTLLTADGISPSAVSPARAVGAFGMAYNGSTWDRQTIDAEGRLHVRAFVTGTVTLETGDINIGAVEIKNANSELRAVVNVLADAQTQPTGTLAVGAYNLIYDIVGDNWDRDPARLVLDDGMVAGVFPQRVSFGMHKDYTGAAWDANFGGDAIADGRDAAMELKNALNVRSILYAKNSGAQSFDRLIGPKETGLNVSLISGSFPGQTEASLLTDAFANPRVGQVGSFNMVYDVVGDNWDRDPARLVLADGMSQGVFPQRISFGMHQDYGTGLWDANFGGNATVDGVSPPEDLKNALNTRSILYALNGAGTLDRLRGPRESGLNVSLVSGTWPTDPLDVNILSGAGSILVTGSVVADTELAAATLFTDGEDPPTTAPVWSFLMGYNATGDEWNRVKIASLGATVTTVNLSSALATAAVLYGRSNNENTLIMARIDPDTGGLLVQVTGTAIVDTEFSAAVAAADGMANPTSPQVLSQLMGYNGTTWDRLRGSAELGLNINSISGSFPDGADVLPGDGIAAGRKSLAVTSYLMGYNGVTYDRLYMGQSGSLAVDLITQLDAVNDEITAYVTGSVRIDGQTKVIQRAVINISGTSAGANAEGLLLLGVASERIKVLSLAIGGAVGFGATIKSGFSGSVIGLMEVNALANGPMTVVPPPPTSDGHWLETEAGDDLIVQGDVAEWHAKGFMTYYTE